MDAPRLGAHMSIAGGPHRAIRRGHAIGCDAIQMFTRNANRWQAKELTGQEVAAFREARQETGIDLVVAHSSYLINLATADDALWARSCEALISELTRCAQLGIDRYVLHPGAYTDSSEEAGLARIAQGLAHALDEPSTGEVTILLENMAGQGSSLGHTFGQLRWLIDHTACASRLGTCFDTAHALAAGYEFRGRDAYQVMWADFDAIIGIARLGAIHLNDAKRDLGSRVDRHTHIGQGHVGLEAFRLLVNDAQLRHVPMLLETPKGEDLAEDIENLAVLRGLLGRSALPSPEESRDEGIPL